MSEYPKVDIPENCCDGKKNEYLEKIKELLDDGCFDCCTNQYPVSRDSVKEVWAIAERMAAEIERLTTADVLSDEAAIATTKYIEELEADVTRLKAELEKYKEKIHHLYDINSELAQANSDTNFQLNFFKAELEKRSEVVRCGECKKQGSENCPRYHYDEVYMEHFYPEDNSYCEHGQRR